ncbi:c-type cytochrome [Pigmentiphaga litoralis]|uniref:c-type cytochrome n=1 Tax=Pigmentiphaga litoralis TaxID=516702 RepID=UPI003B42C4BA
MAVGLVVVLGVAFAVLMSMGHREDERDAVRPAASDLSDAARIEQGRYLALVGNCMGCHTAVGGTPYAGGRALPTPFGTFYGPNLTSDAETGLGKWSADDFWRALHNGKAPDGQLLYPAFPYATYTQVSRDDADALFAYLRSLAPVKHANRAHDLVFPYDQRELVAVWRALYFRPGNDAAKAGRPAATTGEPAAEAQLLRGRYLVDGIGHCAECHTPRNRLGALQRDASLSGARIPGQSWYAPPLSGDPVTGLGKWSAQDIAELLQTGISRRGSAAGPMAEAVHVGLQYVRDDDANAMAAYLKSLPGQGLDAGAVGAAPSATVMETGRGLYEAQCTQCHKSSGEGVYPAWPPLAGNLSVTAPDAVNAIRLVLRGGFSPSTAGHPQPHGMPPFGQAMKDQDVAAVVSYIRNSWGNSAGGVSLSDVRRVREAR